MTAILHFSKFPSNPTIKWFGNFSSSLTTITLSITVFKYFANAVKMPDQANNRLIQIKDFLTGNKTATTLPWDPNSTKFPTRKELPKIPGAPDQAAWVWGESDYIGRLNLLTPTRVAAAAKEIRTGDIVPVNLPLNMPEVPAFGREPFRHEIKVLTENIAYDDIYHLNTQSGTQWDGFRVSLPSNS